MTNCHTWLGSGGKAAVGGYREKSLKEPRLVPPVLELVLMKRGDVMIVQ